MEKSTIKWLCLSLSWILIGVSGYFVVESSKGVAQLTNFSDQQNKIFWLEDTLNSMCHFQRPDHCGGVLLRNPDKVDARSYDDIVEICKEITKPFREKLTEGCEEYEEGK